MRTALEKLQEKLPSLKKKYPLLSLGIFGSYSRGEETASSDLDIVYETLPNTFLNLYSYLDLKEELHEITNLKIDLINKAKVNAVIWLTAKNDVQYV